MASRAYEVEFLGGPLDGHKVFLPVTVLARRLALPVNRNVVEMLQRRQRGPLEPVTSVAIYRLRKVVGGLHYIFVEAVETSRFSVKDWQD